MHRAGPGERGGASYGRRAVATAKWAPMQISGVGKGLIDRAFIGAAKQCDARGTRSYSIDRQNAFAREALL